MRINLRNLNTENTEKRNTEIHRKIIKGRRHIVQGLLFTGIVLKYIKFPGKILNNMTYKYTDICEKKSLN